jgi:3-hydroxyacyl-[acyl-carrier-protein] dehydratase
MGNNYLNKDQIIKLLPHREPMLLIDELIDIVPNKSAVGIVNVKKESFYFQGHFPRQPIMPGVIIVEAFGQAAAALTAHSLSSEEVEDKLVYLMSVNKARFRNPIIPECKLLLDVEAIRTRGKVWRYKGVAKVNGKKMADAEWAATIIDRGK